ncbi:MAG: ARMT1-like domain-containing protein [Desulfarculaceae bacterium]|nr:ARMT1-like domain-containing protein [Desulfarculaceae bacterium]MCF8072365.1 ARMT1-like domain-containing protein [Desulfarculaceae bacterium]MCF8100286.1 ARMT1-like domain-containing protein [Desulfarculaceae bacterium]MCF8116141.1 ARMT1-like domain-containing protein [Desulfarculaceae bacterium]
MGKHLIPGEQCASCLEGLIEATIKGSGLEAEAEQALRSEIEALTREGLAQGLAPAHIATRFFDLTRERSGVHDPFTAKKEADFLAAQEAVAKLGPQPDDFSALARVAILGNAIDHFFLADTGRLWEEGGGLELGRDDLARAEVHLRPGASVVILADNCGEQSFDRLLVEHLENRGCAVSYVVKNGPAQNDLTLADLAAQNEAHGLGEVLDWSPAAVGLDPEGLPPNLDGLLAGADLVIAKGMGHYETLAVAGGMLASGSAPWPLLLLFLAKCATIAQSVGASKGQGVALYLPAA